METINQKNIAAKAGVKAYFLNHILHGRRPCPPYLAPKLESVTGIDRTVWVWGTKEEKLSSWTSFMEQQKKTA